MTDILNFPGRFKTDDRQELIQHQNETLQFGSDCEATRFTVAASEKVRLSSLYGETKGRYWSNQELASLFRVKRLLDAAGITCDVDHGSTDEGDPWFVFCDGAGEVFIHLCRIDGEYLLDSPNIETPLTGWDFNDLIESFVQRNIPEDGHPAAGAGPRVVRFERNGQVFMHPSTMLAALIWTLFLDSEDMVMLLPEDTDAQTAAVNALAGQALVSDPPHAENLLKDDIPIRETGIDPHSEGEKPAAAHLLAQLVRDVNTPQNDSKFHYSTYAVGLSAIAISYGFMSDSPVPEIGATTMSIAEMLEDTRAADTNEQEAALAALDENAFDFLSFIQNIFGSAQNAAETTELAGTDPETAGEQVQAGDGQKILQAYLKDILDEAHPDAADAIAFKLDPGKLDPGMDRDGRDTAENADRTELDGKSLQNQPGDHGTGGAQDIAESFLANLSLTRDGEIALDNLRSLTPQDNHIRATFDVTKSFFDKTDGFFATLGRDSETPLSDDSTIGFPDFIQESQQRYDERAEVVLQFIIERSEDLEIVAQNEAGKEQVMFFDSSVMNAKPDDVMVFSWALENGDVISAMGLRSDLETADYLM